MSQGATYCSEGVGSWCLVMVKMQHSVQRGSRATVSACPVASRLLGFSACPVASRLLGFSACPAASRLRGFSASRLARRLLGFAASRLLGLSGGFSASRLLGFLASRLVPGFRLLGFSASRLVSYFAASRLLGFSASRLVSGFSASRLLGFSASGRISGPLLPVLWCFGHYVSFLSFLAGFQFRVKHMQETHGFLRLGDSKKTRRTDWICSEWTRWNA